MVGFILVIMAIGVTSGFWRLALSLRSSNGVVKFYRMAFWLYAVLLTATAGVMLTLLELGHNLGTLAEAIILGLTASFVLFILFAWGRLTIVGFMYLASHTQPEI